ncbi:MAG: (Fe-S)-binding protein [Thermoplasmatota archaeon]
MVALAVRPLLCPVEPSAVEKRSSLARLRALSLQQEIDIEFIKRRLRGLRESSLRQSGRLLERFQRSARRAGLHPSIVRDAAEAARYIKRSARGCSQIFINNSHTVRALAPLLEREGFSLVDTYLAETGSADLPGEAWRPWQVGEPEPGAVWEAFTATLHPSTVYGTPLPTPEGGWVAALGLSAASAEDASLFFVQHTHNITKLLFSASKLFVIGGVERVVRTREDALFQARCAALFGLPAALEAGGAASGPSSSSDGTEVPFLPSWPEEVHVVLIEGGRRALLRSVNRRVLECIGCRACWRGCAMAFEGTASPRDSLMDWMTAGAREGDARALYSCTLCHSCESSCPLGIPLPDYSLALRRARARRGELPEVFRAQRESILALGNPLGENPSARSQFYPPRADGSPAARLKKGAPTLLYLGCVASFQRHRIVESAFNALSATGLEFSVLGEQEVCCGYPLYAAGLREFERAAARNIERIRASGARRVVTTCAGCCKTLAKIYPEYFDIDFETVHIVEHLAGLVSGGKLAFTRSPLERAEGPAAGRRAVAYHDPCDLGRSMGVYEPPRELLAAMPGVEPVELPFNRQASRCCGAGGGAKGFDPRQSEAMAMRRMLEAADTGAEVVTSACPACLANLQSVTPRVRRDRGRTLRFLDITELAARALGHG